MKTLETLKPSLDPEHELKTGEKKDQLSSPEVLEELEAPITDMFLENGKEGDIAEAEEDIKNSPEKQEGREIKTVADFLEILEDEILELEEKGDEEDGIKLAYHLIKIKGALRQAKIKPEKLSLMSLNNDEMVDYDRSKRKLKVRRDILEDLGRDLQFLKTVFTELQFEKNQDIRDTGFQLLLAKKKMSINKEVGKKERQATEGTFDNLGISKALDLYNFKNPEKLADYFLEKEVTKRLKSGRKIKPFQLAIYLYRVFKKGAPELYKELRKKKYDWRTKTKELITN